VLGAVQVAGDGQAADADAGDRGGGQAEAVARPKPSTVRRVTLMSTQFAIGVSVARSQRHRPRRPV
jgi:hypothetical protein